MNWDSDLRAVVVVAEFLLGLGLLAYRPVSARNAPDDPEAAREYVARMRRNRRLIGLYVLFLSIVQIPSLFARF